MKKEASEAGSGLERMHRAYLQFSWEVEVVFPQGKTSENVRDIGGSHNKEVKESITGKSENLDTLQV